MGKRMLILRGYEFSIVQIAFDIKFKEQGQRALRNFANNYSKPWNYDYTIVRRLNTNNIISHEKEFMLVRSIYQLLSHLKNLHTNDMKKIEKKELK